MNTSHTTGSLQNGYMTPSTCKQFHNVHVSLLLMSLQHTLRKYKPVKLDQGLKEDVKKS